MNSAQAPKHVVKLVDDFLNDQWGPVMDERERDRIVNRRLAMLPGGDEDLTESWVDRLGDVDFEQHPHVKGAWMVHLPDDSGQIVVLRSHVVWSENKELPDGETAEFDSSGSKFDVVVHDEGGTWKLTSPTRSQFKEGEKVYALAFNDGSYLVSNAAGTFSEEWKAEHFDDSDEGDVPPPRNSGTFLRDEE